MIWYSPQPVRATDKLGMSLLFASRPMVELGMRCASQVQYIGKRDLQFRQLLCFDIWSLGLKWAQAQISVNALACPLGSGDRGRRNGDCPNIGIEIPVLSGQECQRPDASHHDKRIQVMHGNNVMPGSVIHSSTHPLQCSHTVSSYQHFLHCNSFLFCTHYTAMQCVLDNAFWKM